MHDRVVFNCSYWSGMTIVHGNASFFNLMYQILDSICEYKNLNDDEFQLIMKNNRNHASCSIYHLMSDIDFANNGKSSNYCSELEEQEFHYFKFNHINQLTITRSIAFEIGERIRSGLNNIEKISGENYNAMYAFSRVVQKVALGPKVREL